MSEAYPLKWPAGWPRAKYRATAKFSQAGARGGSNVAVTVAVARQRLQNELDMLRAGYITLSTNMELRLDGQPRSGLPEPIDPGAALYFRLSGRDTVLACDKWNRVADNITAIAKHIEAIRGMDRWGVGTAAQAFAGYQAIAAPEQWWEVLGVPSTASVAEIDRAWRARIADAHPDRGGSDALAARLNRARDDGRAANA